MRLRCSSCSLQPRELSSNDLGLRRRLRLLISQCLRECFLVLGSLFRECSGGGGLHGGKTLRFLREEFRLDESIDVDGCRCCCYHRRGGLDSRELGSQCLDLGLGDGELGAESVEVGL